MGRLSPQFGCREAEPPALDLLHSIAICRGEKARAILLDLLVHEFVMHVEFVTIFAGTMNVALSNRRLIGRQVSEVNRSFDKATFIMPAKHQTSAG